MLKLLKEVFRTGEATIKYPFAPAEVSKDFRGKPEHQPVQCIACGACAIACPSNAITIENDLSACTRTWSIFYGRCIFCGRCEESCPTAAIKLTSDFELAVASKQDLIHKAVFSLAVCPVCGDPFAPAKEVAYVAELLASASQDPADDVRRLVATCPECKRKRALDQMAQPVVNPQTEEWR